VYSQYANLAERFLPTVDGTARALARLMEHLELEGHHCILLGPHTGMDSYAGHPLVGTASLPFISLVGLKVRAA
jgi:hypothetical protein